MEYLLEKRYFTGQERVIRNYGDDMWALICSNFPVDAHFTRKEIAALFKNVYGWSPRTAYNYTLAFVANCVAMPEGGLFKVTAYKLRFHDINGE